jgi:hypothetical protein
MSHLGGQYYLPPLADRRAAEELWAMEHFPTFLANASHTAYIVFIRFIHV